jgi:hypothetical protein
MIRDFGVRLFVVLTSGTGHERLSKHVRVGGSFRREQSSRLV